LGFIEKGFIMGKIRLESICLFALFWCVNGDPNPRKTGGEADF